MTEIRTTLDPDGFRLEYRPDTKEILLIFKLPEPGLLSVDSVWLPNSVSMGCPEHKRHTMIENR